MLTFETRAKCLKYAEDNGYFAVFLKDGGTLQNLMSGHVIPFLIESMVKHAEAKSIPKIILSFSGKAGAGKNTAATLVAKICSEMQSKYTVIEYSFAAYLKQMAKEQYGWDGDKTLYPDDVTDKGRNLLIWLAKKYRDEDPDFWARHLIDDVIDEHIRATHRDKKCMYIITDTRYRNEIQLLRELEEFYQGEVKLYCLKVTRPNELHIDSPSEKDLDSFFGFDLTIQNNGSMEQLKENLKDFLDSIGGI